MVWIDVESNEMLYVAWQGSRDLHREEIQQISLLFGFGLLLALVREFDSEIEVNF